LPALSACGTSEKPVPSGGPLSGRVTVDGSATVFPLSKAMAEAFRESNPACKAQHVEYIEVPVAFWCPARPAISRQYQTFRLVYFGGTYMDQEYPA